MRTVSMLGTLFVLASASLYAETWTGKLLDADCRSRNATEACTPTTSSSSFMFEVSGKNYKFDQAGNKKAADALKKSESGAERARNPEDRNTEITATVNGTLRGEQIEISSITVH